MNVTIRSLLLLLTAASAVAPAAEPEATSQPTTQPAAGVEFRRAATDIHAQLAESIAELNAIRERVGEVKRPLQKALNDAENELLDARSAFDAAARQRDLRALELSRLKDQIKAKQDESDYLQRLFGEYVRNFESGLHIAEVKRYSHLIEVVKRAPTDKDLSPSVVYYLQAELLRQSLDRLDDSLGGMRFAGEAAGPTGEVKPGTFLLVGPVGLFRADDGSCTGLVQQKRNSLEPSVQPFGRPEDQQAAEALMASSSGVLPLDPTLGNAQKIAETQQTLMEHIEKGGPVMYPILGMAGLALIVVILKWIGLSRIPTPNRKQVDALMDAVADGNVAEAERRVQPIRGPIGKMLSAGVAHMREDKELIEEIMYETVLSTKLRLQRMLPFVAIAAASAPLLGLLGTVTGIINTFKLITVFGSGDVKMLSGGISEALITTEFGLIVAIPALLLHAFLSRKAKGFANEMERTAVTFVNQVGMARLETPKGPAAA